MPLILCHSPKGGASTTFTASHLAIGLSGMDGSDGIGGDITLLTLSQSDMTPLHFGLPPAQRLPAFGAAIEAAVLVSGISLRCEPFAAQDPDFLGRLDDGGFLAADSARTLVIDVPAGEPALASRLMPHAAVHICPLTASPDCLALLPQLLEQDEATEGSGTAYVIGKLDETRRLARHVAAFMREVLGDKIIAKIRQDQSVPEALAMLQPLSRYAPASAALADVRQMADVVRGMLEMPTAADPGQTDSDGAALTRPAPGASRAA